MEHQLRSNGSDYRRLERPAIQRTSGARAAPATREGRVASNAQVRAWNAVAVQAWDRVGVRAWKAPGSAPSARRHSEPPRLSSRYRDGVRPDARSLTIRAAAIFP